MYAYINTGLSRPVSKRKQQDHSHQYRTIPKLIHNPNNGILLS